MNNFINLLFLSQILTTFSQDSNIYDHCRNLLLTKINSEDIYNKRCTGLKILIKKEIAFILENLGASVIHKDHCEVLQKNIKNVENVLREFCGRNRNARQLIEDDLSCQENSIYNECGTKCPQTCKTLEQYVYCNKMCRSGCQCEDGYVWYDVPFNSECVPLNSCKENANLVDRIDDVLSTMMKSGDLIISKESVVNSNELNEITDRIYKRIERYADKDYDYSKTIDYFDEGSNKNGKMGLSSRQIKDDGQKHRADTELKSQCEELQSTKIITEVDYKKKCENQEINSIKHKVEMYFRHNGAKLDVNTYCNMLKMNLEKAEKVSMEFCHFPGEDVSDTDKMWEEMIQEIVKKQGVHVDESSIIGNEDDPNINSIVDAVKNKLDDAEGDTLEEKLKNIFQEAVSEQKSDPGQGKKEGKAFYATSAGKGKESQKKSKIDLEKVLREVIIRKNLLEEEGKEIDVEAIIRQVISEEKELPQIPGGFAELESDMLGDITSDIDESRKGLREIIKAIVRKNNHDPEKLFIESQKPQTVTLEWTNDMDIVEALRQAMAEQGLTIEDLFPEKYQKGKEHRPPFDDNTIRALVIRTLLEDLREQGKIEGTERPLDKVIGIPSGVISGGGYKKKKGSNMKKEKSAFFNALSPKEKLTSPAIKDDYKELVIDSSDLRSDNDNEYDYDQNENGENSKFFSDTNEGKTKESAEGASGFFSDTEQTEDDTKEPKVPFEMDDGDEYYYES